MSSLQPPIEDTASRWQAATAATQQWLPKLLRREGHPLLLAAAAAGLAGAGVQPPPLGLLQAVLEEPRNFDLPHPGPALLLTGALAAAALLAAAVLARCFSFNFAAQALEAPRSPAFIRSAGWRHFWGASLLTAPLYLLLFAGEAIAARRIYSGLLEASEAERLPVLLSGLMIFAAVLLPWVLLTLPAMQLLYELIPVEMLADEPPRFWKAGRAIVTRIRAHGRAYGRLVLLRLVIQVAGSLLLGLSALAAAAAALLLTGPPAALLSLLLPSESLLLRIAFATLFAAGLTAGGFLLSALSAPVNILLFQLARCSGFTRSPTSG